MGLFRLLDEHERGPLAGEIAALAKRDPFSRYLPYRAYDEDRCEYINTDNTIGRAWECRPVAFFSDKAFKSLVGILRQEYPEQTVFQFCLYPDDNIAPVLDAYLKLKTRKNERVQQGARRYAQHLLEGRTGLDALRGIPVRRFRLFVSVKSPEALPPEQVATIQEGLTAAGLAPRPLEPGVLLGWLRRVFNRNPPANAEAYDPGAYLCNQIIDADDPVTEIPGGLTFGGRFAACLTPKATPDSIDPMGANCLIGGFGGTDEDATQIKNRFLWTTTVFFKGTKSSIKTKASWTMMQRGTGALAKSLQKRVTEFSWVIDQLEKVPFCNVITSCWVFGDDEDDLNRGLARVRGLWENQNFVMQRETQIQKAMLVAALPFGLYTGKNWSDVALLERDFMMSALAAAMLLPVQADFSGGMRPVMVVVGRKGGLVTLDVFDKGASNHNFLIAASTGSGKSFKTNFLVDSYYGTSAFVRATDIGHSYYKQCLSVGGRYIDIGGDEIHRLTINPFQVAGNDAEDRTGNDVATAYVILTMIYSNTGTASVNETQVNLVKEAVAFARQRDGGEYGVDHVREFLATYPKHAGEAKLDSAINLAHEMGYNLRDWVSKGTYGRLVNGRSTLDISCDDFVVFELEHLQNNPELFRVMSLQVINATTQDLYLTKDRSVRRFMLFDEAWRYLGKGDASASTSLIGKIIEEAYRRARKYGGATGIVTQSPLDLISFGDAGKVIRGNSAFKFFLESNTYAEAVRLGVLDYNGLLFDLVNSVRNNKPLYSEILYETPFGCGVGRLCMDRFNYWSYTTDASEVQRWKGVFNTLEGDVGTRAAQAIVQCAGLGE